MLFRNYNLLHEPILLMSNSFTVTELLLEQFIPTGAKSAPMVISDWSELEMIFIKHLCLRNPVS